MLFKKSYEPHNQSVRDRNKERNDHHDLMREKIAAIYLQGKGLEIGGLHKPLITPPGATVKYLDRLSSEDLRKQYPELDPEPMVHVEIIDNGETMTKVKDQSQDFVVASHFYEHTADSIMAFKNLMRVTKKGGLIFLVIPDKRFTFDKDREITTFEHILEDHEKGPDHHRLSHFQDWVHNVDGITAPDKAEARVQELLEMDYSIHYHVWDPNAMLGYFVRLHEYLDGAFELMQFSHNTTEMILVLRKN